MPDVYLTAQEIVMLALCLEDGRIDFPPPAHQEKIIKEVHLKLWEALGEEGE